MIVFIGDYKEEEGSLFKIGKHHKSVRFIIYIVVTALLLGLMTYETIMRAK